MHPDIHRLAPTAPSRHAAVATRAPRRSVRVRVDDMLVAVGNRTARVGRSVADHGARRGGQLTSGHPPGWIRPA